MTALKQNIIKIFEVFFLFTVLMYFSEISVGSNFLKPIEWRAWIVSIIYIIAVISFSWFRMYPKNIRNVLINSFLLIVAQCLWFSLSVFVFRQSGNHNDIGIVKWYLNRVPFVIIPTFLGGSMIQFALLLILKLRQK